MKILIADDEKEILEFMVKKVKSDGHDVIPAENGKEAWDKIVSENPDIILLDLIMPEMGGYEVLQNLRENPPSKKWQPVIIISALGDLENIQKGFSMEADHYITKPCSMDDVLKGIKMMMQLIPSRKSESELKEE